MKKPLFRIVGGLALALLLYLLAWPVPIEPVAWNPPPEARYAGPFAVNGRLKGLEAVSIGSNHGPEAVAMDGDGRLYVATEEGNIVRLDSEGSHPENWVNTGGRPLGMAFDRSGNLIVADGRRGLLSVAPGGAITTLATEADGVPIGLADDVDVAADGRIYFSDASTKFGRRQWGAGEASRLDVLEHGGHGRLLVFDPATSRATTLVRNLNFANGVAIGHDQRFVLVTETGSYRVLRVGIVGPDSGRVIPFIEGLPGFPDNITRGREGQYWVALFAPRNALLDGLARYPFLRKMIQRIPTRFQPQATSYGHVFALDDEGRVIDDLQDPAGGYPMNTSVLETPRYLYIGSLVAPALARLRR